MPLRGPRAKGKTISKFRLETGKTLLWSVYSMHTMKEVYSMKTPNITGIHNTVAQPKRVMYFDQRRP